MSEINKTVYTAIADKWAKGGPPARPTPSELQIFEKYIKKTVARGGKRMLVLGATPEFRDLGMKCGLKVWACDINPNMIAAMNRIIKSQDKGETIIADWLEMSQKLPKNYFDLILAEQSSNIVSLKDWPKLCYEIQEVARGDALVLLKIQTVPYCRESAFLLLKRYQGGNLKAGDLSFWLHFAPETRVHNVRKNTLDLKKETEFLDQLLQKKKITSRQWREHEDAIGAIQRGGIVLNVLPAGKTTMQLKRYFRIVRLEQGNDLEMCKYMPIYVLRKK